MSRRMLLPGVLVCLVLIGLTAGAFMNSIQNALTLPARLPNNAPAQAAPGKQPAPPTTTPAPPTATPATMVQMPQNILAQDTFQRANQFLWGTASDGRPWGGDANVQANIFSVHANHGQIMNGNGTFNALLGPSVPNAEVMLDGSLSHFDGTVNLGVVLRYTDPNNWYKALIDGKHLTLLKHVDAQSTTLATVAFSAHDNQSYVMRFRVVGAMLFARVWPAGTTEPTNWMITAADTSFQTGQAGIRVVLEPGMTITVTSFAAATATSSI
ncbi:MAG TPA: hypothetical protein VGN34_25320 [Ktedonobacteraceae bacterium]